VERPVTGEPTPKKVLTVPFSPQRPGVPIRPARIRIARVALADERAIPSRLCIAAQFACHSIAAARGAAHPHPAASRAAYS
jgi:hypothetical protein